MSFKIANRFWAGILLVAAFILGLASAAFWGLRGALIVLVVGLLLTPLISGLLWVAEEALFRRARPDARSTREDHH